MPRYFSPIEAISAAGNAAMNTLAQTVASDPSIPAPAADPTATADLTSQVQTADTSQSSPGEADLQKHLEDTLKNTGFKAEILDGQGGYTVLRLVEAQTGQVILQMPTQTVLDIVAGLDGSGGGSASSESTTPGTGVVLDQLA